MAADHAMLSTTGCFLFLDVQGEESSPYDINSYAYLYSTQAACSCNNHDPFVVLLLLLSMLFMLMMLDFQMDPTTRPDARPLLPENLGRTPPETQSSAV